jgi:hypothetical protein
MKTCDDYLKDNGLNISTGLLFTCKDYDFIIKINDTSIIINKGRFNREELLTKKDIINRIYDLLQLYKKNNLKDMNIKEIENKILRKEKLKKIQEYGCNELS